MLHYVCQKNLSFYLWGDILAGSLTLTANEPVRIPPSRQLRSLGDILAGSLTLTANETTQMSTSCKGVPLCLIANGNTHSVLNFSMRHLFRGHIGCNTFGLSCQFNYLIVFYCLCRYSFKADWFIVGFLFLLTRLGGAR